MEDICIRIVAMLQMQYELYDQKLPREVEMLTNKTGLPGTEVLGFLSSSNATILFYINNYPFD